MKGPTAIYIGKMKKVDGSYFLLYNLFNCDGFKDGSTVGYDTAIKIPNIIMEGTK